MGRLLSNWFVGSESISSGSLKSKPGVDECDLSTGESSPSDSSSTRQPATPPDNLNDELTMPTTSPIAIQTPSSTSSSSPSSHGQKPNYHDSDTRTSAIMSGTGGFESSMSGRGGQDFLGGGAKPISMNNPNRNADARGRRESLAGSLVGGMSWGGVSVGSWIRDDIIMAGTSPFPYQSPSFHSSSYLPKLEAEFMKNFACCGKTLPSLHDLLQHYEEAHAESTPQSLRNGTMAARAREGSTPNSKAHFQSEAASKIQQQSQQGQSSQQQRPQISVGQGSGVGGIAALRQQQSQPATPTQKNVHPVGEDMDGVEDMEMDDPVGTMDMSNDLSVKPTQPMPNQQSMFGQQRPQLNMGSNGMSGLRNNMSQPTTPAATNFTFNNPTVSSVNTPTLSAQPTQQTFSPDTSVPGTPAELDDDFANMAMNMNLGNMNMNMNMANMGNMGNMNFPYGMAGSDLGLDLCIDEPAKRLFSPNGGFSNQSQRALQQQFQQQFGMNQNNQFGSQEQLMRAYRQQQMIMNGMTGNMMMAGEEHKPFRCPVVGCEKAYKNQNGLKYHKTHGHTTQQLHENGDGTFSIVNPETSTPYPGTLGMEKEKPYKCEVCGKRYKNLNGLKYHKQHSPPCNPELKLNNHMVAAGLAGLNNINIPGLPGIGEEGMM
ncbi:hypothetical protein BP6252_06899 [Coleophoma cylindrospora]|uniref:C2H2-type domain-containing protein n=1 Tax=Coleophoma cylindrospora TaxID=1849047 RepID=A0A3D8RG27_9HELO|nr:hypothetical protein BP6252_06899 [Coleophoma cylindrospora]